jgi:hypothetical protein
MALNKDFIVKQGIVAEGTADSSSTSTGALIVAGGAGVGGNLNVRGYISRVGAVSGTDFSQGAALKFLDATYTDVAAVGTIPWNVINYFGQSLVDTTNTNVTVTNAATIFVQGAPSTASTNLSVLNPYSIYVTSGTVYIGETKGSTSTAAGQALQVAGGLSFTNGIYGTGGGNFYGTYYIENSEIVTRATMNVGVAEFPNEVRILTNTNAISTGSGALQIPNGGAGIGGNLYIGGRFVGQNTGTFLSTENAVSTSTGALTLQGGLGVGQDLYARNGFFVSGDANLTSVAGNSLEVTNGGGLGVAGSAYIGGQVYLADGTDAANTYSGALVIQGGLGVGQTLYAQKIVVADDSAAISESIAPLVVLGGVGITKNLIIGATDSSTGTTATNALVVAGGVAIGRDLSVDGSAVIKGDLLLLGQGTQVVVNSTNTYIVDPVIEIGGGIDGTMLQVPDVYDKGLLVHYQNAVNTLTDYRAFVGIEQTNQHFILKTDILPDENGRTDVSQLYTTGSWATLEAGKLVLHNTDGSNSAYTGALQVAGGVYVGGASYFGPESTSTFINGAYSLSTVTGNTIEVPNGGIGAKYLYVSESGYINGSQIITTGTVNTNIGGEFTATFFFSNPTESWSTDSGGVVFGGGIGIRGNLNMGGNFVTTGTAYVWSTEESINTTSGSLVIGGGAGLGGRLNVGGNVRVYSTAGNFTSTDGALVIDGGVGIAENVNLGGTLDVGQSGRIGTNLTVENYLDVKGTADSLNRASGTVTIGGGLGVAETINATRINVETASINSGTVSTGTAYGDLVVAGGVGIGGDVWINNTVHVLSQNTVTSTTGTGALEVWGGVGIGEGLKVAGSIERVGDVQSGKWTVNGPGLQLSTSTYTDLNSTGLNAGNAVIHSINRPYLVGTLNPTWQNIATLFVEDAPTITGAASAQNRYALWVNNGQVKIGSTAINNGTTNTGALQVVGGAGIGGNLTVGGTVSAAALQVVSNQITSTSTVGISSNGQITIDTFNGGSFRTAKYLVQVTDTGYVPNKFHVVEIMITYDGSAQTNGSYISQYGIVTNTGELGDFNAVYNGGLIQVTFTPNYVPTAMSVQALRTAITA